MTYDDLLARVRTLIVTSEQIPVVAITGHGGAGKSTLAARLGADLGLEPDQVIGTDAFYAPTCGPEAGMWEQHDWALIEALVRGARSRPSPCRLRFDYRWWTGETGPRRRRCPREGAQPPAGRRPGRARPLGHQVDPRGP